MAAQAPEDDRFFGRRHPASPRNRPTLCQVGAFCTSFPTVRPNAVQPGPDRAAIAPRSKRASAELTRPRHAGSPVRRRRADWRSRRSRGVERRRTPRPAPVDAPTEHDDADRTFESGWRALCLLAVGLRTRLARRDPTVLRLATTTSTADTGLLGGHPARRSRSCAAAAWTSWRWAPGRRSNSGGAAMPTCVLVHAYEAGDAVPRRAPRPRALRRDVQRLRPRRARRRPGEDRGPEDRRDARSPPSPPREAPFASRGDKSGTHTAELALVGSRRASSRPGAWYRSLGQGMGETLVVANEQRAYTLSDRGTWLSMREKVPGPDAAARRSARSPRIPTRACATATASWR